MVKAKIISSGNKAFIDEKFDDFEALERISALGGETVYLALLISNEDVDDEKRRILGDVTVKGKLSEYVTLRDVRSIAVEKPCEPGKTDEWYLRTTPGIYPDLLTPLRYRGRVVATRDALRTVWIEVNIPEGFKGDDTLTVTLDFPDTAESVTASVEIHVIAANLPKQKTHFTQWFYCDCLANYYEVEPWSEEHWRIIENFIALARKRGRDTVYTPIFTPALNTLNGFERTTTQLIGVRVDGGKYTFDFSNLDRWIEICNRTGIDYLEISHLYDQHQAKHSAIVYATVDGEYKRIFGWDTDALDERYSVFLRRMLTELVAHMKKRGDDKRCFYHISDEPSLEELDHYTKVKNVVADVLDGYVLMDAISDYEFYKTGAINTPVPTTQHAPAFIEGGVPNLWVYYACNQVVNYSNCYLAMPLHRTRSIGMQLFKYDVKGFLHWGYNYYNNRGSGDGINPFADASGEYWVSAGDTYAVYPGQGGEPLESLRMSALEEAMQDLRAMQLCESLYSHEEVVAAMEQTLGDEINFERCTHTPREMLELRECINRMIEKRV